MKRYFRFGLIFLAFAVTAMGAWTWRQHIRAQREHAALIASIALLPPDATGAFGVNIADARGTVVGERLRPTFAQWFPNHCDGLDTFDVGRRRPGRAGPGRPQGRARPDRQIRSGPGRRLPHAQRRDRRREDRDARPATAPHLSLRWLRHRLPRRAAPPARNRRGGRRHVRSRRSRRGCDALAR